MVQPNLHQKLSANRVPTDNLTMEGKGAPPEVERAGCLTQQLAQGSGCKCEPAVLANVPYS